MKRDLVNFETPVAKEKDSDFLKFLKDHNIKDSQINLKCLSGSYKIYVIDLSSLRNTFFSETRKILVDKQVSFL